MYSVLNPETNSDSPSEKSKGVRFISAIKEINNSKYIETLKKIKGAEYWAFKKNFKSNLFVSQIKERKINTKLTSYDTLWAIERRPPKIEYLDLENQPIKSKG